MNCTFVNSPLLMESKALAGPSMPAKRSNPEVHERLDCHGVLRPPRDDERGVFQQTARLSIMAAGAFVALSAHAADMDAPKAGMKDVPEATAAWTGFYLGINSGYGRAARSGTLDAGAVEFTSFTASSTLSDASPASGWSKLTPEGGFGGGQLGYNVQRNRFVGGVEADIQGASLNGNAFSEAAFQPLGAPLPAVDAKAWAKSSLDWFGTVRGRLGYSFGSTLLYVTGGFAYGGIRDQLGTELHAAANISSAASRNATLTGGVAGGGVEIALSPSWSAKAEYQYIDLGSTTLAVDGAAQHSGSVDAGGASVKIDHAYNTVRLGLNYKIAEVPEPATGLKDTTSARAVDRPGSASRWTVSTEAIVLERAGGGVSRALIERVPGSVPFGQVPNASGVEVFNSSQFQQGFSAGPKVGLIYHGDSGYGAELSYFNIFNQSSTKAIGPDNPADWLVMWGPAPFWQTQDFTNQAMAWGATTNLFSAEANGRLDLNSRVTVLAGFRWLQLNDNLLGWLSPTAGLPPFWNTSTVNNLYGAQIGVEGKILEYGRFSLDGLIKIGLFDDNAVQSTGVSLEKVVYPSKASGNHAAFVSESGLRLKYQVTGGLALKAGYELLWFDGVALAPGQIQETIATEHLLPPSTVQALGVNSGSNVLFQGFTAGFEYSF
jgi:opacity protein-like surface antigen